MLSGNIIETGGEEAGDPVLRLRGLRVNPHHSLFHNRVLKRDIFTLQQQQQQIGKQGAHQLPLCSILIPFGLSHDH